MKYHLRLLWRRQKIGAWRDDQESKNFITIEDDLSYSKHPCQAVHDYL